MTAIPKHLHAEALAADRIAAGYPPHFDADEWNARLQLAACYRIAAHLGWSELIYNHITLRLPPRPGDANPNFLINPFGLHYSEVCASNLVRIDLDGTDRRESRPRRRSGRSIRPASPCTPRSMRRSPRRTA